EEVHGVIILFRHHYCKVVREGRDDQKHRCYRKEELIDPKELRGIYTCNHGYEEYSKGLGDHGARRQFEEITEETRHETHSVPTSPSKYMFCPHPGCLDPLHPSIAGAYMSVLT